MCVCVCGLLELIAIPLVDADSLQSPCAGDALDLQLWKIPHKELSLRVSLCLSLSGSLSESLTTLRQTTMMPGLTLKMSFVLFVRQGPVLLHVAAAADPVVCDGQVEDQAPAARCIPEVVPDLHVAAPLACACCGAVLCSHDVSSCPEERA